MLVKKSLVTHQEIRKEERRRRDLTAAAVLKMKKERKGMERNIIQSDREKADTILLNLTKD